jgi:F-box-like
MTELYEDALLLIFRHLTYKDLANCEAVCSMWRGVMLTGTPWRTCFHKEMATSPRWREVWKKTGIDEKKLRSADYRDIYRAMHMYLKELDNNWRTGKCKEINVPIKEGCCFADARDDWVAFLEHIPNPMHNELVFWHKKSQISERFDIGCYTSLLAITKEMFICTNSLAFAVFDRNVGQTTFEVKAEQDRYIRWSVFLNNLLVVCFPDREEAASLSFRLCVWKIESPSNVSLLNQWTFQGECFDVKMDERYIAVSIIMADPQILHLISTETLEIEKSLDFGGKSHTYHQGLLFFQNDKFFQVYDVSSQRYFHELPLPEPPNLSIIDHMIGTNTKYVVIALLYEDKDYEDRNSLVLSVYDFEAIKNPSAESNNLLLATFKFELENYWFIIDETQMYLGCGPSNPHLLPTFHEKVTILDFAPSSFNFQVKS